MSIFNIAPKNDEGFTAIEALGALLMFFLLLPALSSLISLGMTEVEKRSVAQHLKQVSSAAQLYVRTHYDDLLTNSTPTSGPTISIDILRTEGFLSSAFQEKNAWQQNYAFYVRKPSAGVLQTVILTTGGRGASADNSNFANAIAPSTAALAGAFAGYVPTGNIPGQSNQELRGVFDGYRLNLTTLNIVSPGAGHLGAFINLTDEEMSQDFLYRVKVPGHPELNAMTTELDMTDHAVNNVRSLEFTPHSLAEMSSLCASAADNGRVFFDNDNGLYVCRQGKVEAIADSANSMFMTNATVTYHGQYIDKPACPAGTDTKPEIFLAPAVVSVGSSAPPLSAIQAWATDFSTRWQINVRVKGSNSNIWIYPPYDYARVIAYMTCTKQ